MHENGCDAAEGDGDPERDQQKDEAHRVDAAVDVEPRRRVPALVLAEQPALEQLELHQGLVVRRVDRRLPAVDDGLDRRELGTQGVRRPEERAAVGRRRRDESVDLALVVRERDLGLVERWQRLEGRVQVVEGGTEGGHRRHRRRLGGEGVEERDAARQRRQQRQRAVQRARSRGVVGRRRQRAQLTIDPPQRPPQMVFGGTAADGGVELGQRGRREVERPHV